MPCEDFEKKRAELIKKAKEMNISIVEDLSKLPVFSSDASLMSYQPLLVLRPENKEEAIKCVEFCLENGVRITARGGGTSLTGSAVPFKSAIIDVSKLNKFGIDKEKRICVCEPGVILKELNDSLMMHDLFFPVVPSSENACTIGGMVSTNASGLRAIKFGSMKDWVEEITMINGKGEVVKCGNEICGSEGTLGLILEVKLRITEILRERSMDLIYVDAYENIPKIVEDLKRKGATMIEYMDFYSCEKAGIDAGEKNKGCIIACFENDSGEITSEKEMKKIIEKREGVYPILAHEGRFLIEDPKVGLDKIPELLRFLERLNIPVFGHIGIGILHPCFKIKEKGKIEQLYQFVWENGGLVSGEHGYGLRKKKYLPKEIVEKWKVLKSQHDPENFFNPGKMGDENIEEFDAEASLQKFHSKEESLCVNCGLCKVCPVFLVTREEEIGPRARAFFDTAPYYCTICKLCEVSCPLSFKMREKVLELRHELVKRGVEVKEIREMIERIRKYGNPFGKEAKEGEWYCC